MTKNIKLTSVVAISALSSVAIAHPGHDHSHWLSDPIHALSILAIGAVVVTAAFVSKKKLSKKSK